MGEFPSGQRGQTVNLLLIASVVRIHLPPPTKKHQYDWCFFVGEKQVDSNPLKCNMPVAYCTTSPQTGCLLTVCFANRQSNPPSPYCATSEAGGSFAGEGKFVDSNPLKSNMPVACWQNQCKHWFSPYRFPPESGPCCRSSGSSPTASGSPTPPGAVRSVSPGGAIRCPGSCGRILTIHH